jgi:hypothetical protein
MKHCMLFVTQLYHFYANIQGADDKLGQTLRTHLKQ